IFFVIACYVVYQCRNSCIRDGGNVDPDPVPAAVVMPVTPPPPPQAAPPPAAPGSAPAPGVVPRVGDDESEASDAAPAPPPDPPPAVAHPNPFGILGRRHGAAAPQPGGAGGRPERAAQEGRQVHFNNLGVEGRAGRA